MLVGRSQAGSRSRLLNLMDDDDDVPNLDHVARLLEFQFRCTGACLLRAVQGKPRFVLLY